ncbi:uncharacterized protein LOC119486717 [Sebastes umbrosus]|uniref:uncharacterized protein LOC119486717 n=1 Tax=Sebastes umbrosus TaxID=72105 RepID=UPI00189D3257|nr:uncharacterized protein LOC119486717 [Sebastes umbrosus]
MGMNVALPSSQRAAAGGGRSTVGYWCAESRSLVLYNRRDTRMKMICSILLLLSLTSCVSGAFVLNVTQTSYQAEENQDITLEWMFTTRTSSSSKSLYIYCELFADLKTSVLFHLHEGVELPESQDEQFTGRVQWDKDVLRDGRIRLHMSRLRINDSGVYRCDVHTGYGSGSRICRLKVTAAADEPKPLTPTMRPQPERPTMRPQPERPTMRLQPERPTMRPQPESRGKIGLYVGLIAALLVLCAGLCFAVLLSFTKSTGNRGNIYTGEQMSFLKKQPITTNQAVTSSAEIRSCLEANLQAPRKKWLSPAPVRPVHMARLEVAAS